MLNRSQSNPPPSNRFQLRTSIQIPPLLMTSSLSPDAAVSSDSDKPHWYGTRLSTVLLVHRNGNVLFIERDVWKLDDSQSKAKSAPPSKSEAEANSEPKRVKPIRGDPREARVFRFRLDGQIDTQDLAKRHLMKDPRQEGQRSEFGGTP